MALSPLQQLLLAKQIGSASPSGSPQLAAAAQRSMAPAPMQTAMGGVASQMGPAQGQMAAGAIQERNPGPTSIWDKLRAQVAGQREYAKQQGLLPTPQSEMTVDPDAANPMKTVNITGKNGRTVTVDVTGKTPEEIAQIQAYARENWNL